MVGKYAIWISIWGYPYGDPHVDLHGDSHRNPVGMGWKWEWKFHTYQPSRDPWIIQGFEHESRDYLAKSREYELFCITNVHIRSLNLVL